MSLLNSASLVVTPNGYKAGTLYSVIPNTTLGDMTVVRATTATRVNSAGLIESVAINVPRLDYTDSTCPSLLVEPQRTNFVVTSASGTYGSSPASEILAIAPDGENTAIRPVPNTSSNRYQQTIAGGTYSSGDEVTYSWYRKRFSTPVVDSYVGDLQVNVLVNCTQVGVTTEIASSINGYDRFSATLSITDGALSSILRFYFGGVIGTGNSSVAYWGHQLEAGSYPTSYIPTSGSTVTRTADAISKTGISSLINSTEGVLYAEINALKYPVDVNNWLTITDGTNANSVGIQFETNGKATGRIEVGGVGQASITTSVDYSNFIKVAFKYKENDFAWWVNGVEVGTDLSGITFPSNTLNSLQFAYGSGSNKWVGNVKLLAVFNEALSDSELETLTTI